jgi:mannose-1-phosphate guanylyltransferase
MDIMSDNSHQYAVIVAGGSGTRLWPLSRKDIPKQMQAFISERPLIDETADRLLQVFPPERIFISTTANYAEQIKAILPVIPTENIIVEPVAKGPALAFALFAEVIRQRDPDAVIVSLASDHVVAKLDEFHKALKTARDYIADNPESISLIGVQPNHADTGMGYIKVDKQVQDEPVVFSVEKFVEKPSKQVAERYLATGEYYWNVAYYCFKAATLVKAYAEASPASMKGVTRYIESGEAAHFESAPEMVHEIEIINAAKFPLVMIPAQFEWSDIGSWHTLHEILADASDNPSRIVSSVKHHIDIDSHGCMIRVNNRDKLVATVGLENIVIVDTDDTLLVLHKERTQDVKGIIAELKQRGLEEYL